MTTDKTTSTAGNTPAVSSAPRGFAAGSEIELDLAEPCEDVVAEFRYDTGHGGGAELYTINGGSQIELKAADSTLRRWTARVPVKSCKDAKTGDEVVVAGD